MADPQVRVASTQPVIKTESRHCAAHADTIGIYKGTIPNKMQCRPPDRNPCACEPEQLQPMSRRIRFSLLRGVCQLPAYVAHARGFFHDEGIESTVSISPTAWMIPEQLAGGAADFAVIPWTRVAASEKGEAPLKVLCGSGHEEAAIVVRTGIAVEDVRAWPFLVREE